MIKIGVASSIVTIPLTFLFGEWTPLIAVLLVLVALDIFTGIAKGVYDKALRSRTMSQGIIRKMMIFVVIIVAQMIDYTMFQNTPVVKMAVLTYYIGMEGLSIVENLGQMNVPLPHFVSKYLLVLRDKGSTLKEDKKDY